MDETIPVFRDSAIIADSQEFVASGPLGEIRFFVRRISVRLSAVQLSNPSRAVQCATDGYAYWLVCETGRPLTSAMTKEGAIAAVRARLEFHAGATEPCDR